ncbi:MAG: asparagine--tRNA ligase [candidate division WOR-3 bacterium]|nr:asparagine--tRNA ligase [candidate division WOR-3 bacterium]MCX7837661.1 asparagine--tRNA ligase [candidate division WOR-3 bacterium]MDW8113379.1 asparagine--tRNA ligase [candidate division WOR-3 bacterium]
MIWIENIGNYEGKEVVLKGWVYNKRSSGKVRFVLIRDGTGILQAVFSAQEVDENSFDLADKVTQESLVELKGIVRKDERAPGGFELVAKELKLLSSSENYPITKKEHGVDFLLQHRHLWIRSRKQFAILRIRAEVIKACRDFLDNKGFILIDAPILTPTSCEGTTTLFEVNYFDRKAYLSQSGQLYNEAAAAAFGRVYCFGPTFRAEKSKTRRHLTEFWMVEPEASFMELFDIIELAEEMIVYIVERVLEKRKKELEILERDVSLLSNIKRPFPRITYDEAIKRLQEKGFKINWGDDFGGDEETFLSNLYEKPLVIYYYPAKCKAFYMKRLKENPEISLSVDILAPEGYGEIVGGGQREDDLKELEKRLIEYNLPREPFEWYLDLRKYGSFIHSGFGLGIERTVAWICKIKHIREAIPFPRMLDRIYP